MKREIKLDCMKEDRMSASHEQIIPLVNCK